MKFRLLKWLVVLGWAGVIFAFSHIPYLTVTDGPSDFWLRKSAHMGEYAALAILIFWAIGWPEFRWRWTTASVVWLLTVWYAVSDEWHQSFVVGRNGTPIDVAIDGIGASLGVLAVAWWLWWRRSLMAAEPEKDLVADDNLSLDRVVTEDQLRQIAHELSQSLQPGSVIALRGDLGAGKTTFVQHLADALGVAGAVTSPTFTLQKQYQTDKEVILHHFDWYRLERAEEIVQLGVADLWQNGDNGQRPATITVIEWPERATDILPDHTIWITFDYVDATTRRITINH
jgi:tRNA threonylcarbamoyladenosine biosynthesis protein TsaE